MTTYSIRKKYHYSILTVYEGGHYWRPHYYNLPRYIPVRGQTTAKFYSRQDSCVKNRMVSTYGCPCTHPRPHRLKIPLLEAPHIRSPTIGGPTDWKAHRLQAPQIGCTTIGGPFITHIDLRLHYWRPLHYAYRPEAPLLEAPSLRIPT